MKPAPSSPLVTSHWSLVTARGQSLLEYAVLIGVAAAAMVAVSDYVQRAFNQHAEAINEELSGPRKP